MFRFKLKILRTAFYGVFALATLKKEIKSAASSSIQAAVRKCRLVQRLACLALVHRTPERPINLSISFISISNLTDVELSLSLL